VYLTDQDPKLSSQLGMQLFAESRIGQGPTAIYAASDTIAIGILRAAYQSGVRVPLMFQ
jgi:DNA-binding LacI/PurR family transcriptional regulator